MEERKTLKYKWIAFKDILFTPIVFISLIFTIVLIYASIKYKNNIEFSIFSGLAGSFLAAVFGAFFKEGYAKLTEESILEKKGESALRNIRSIEGQIDRIRVLIDFFTSKKYKNKLSNIELNEIDRHLVTMAISTNSGVEDWTDILPVLKEKKAKEKELLDDIRPLIEELLKKRVEFVRSKNAKEKKILERKIEELEEKIDRQRIEKGGVSIMSGSNSFLGLPINLNQSKKDPSLYIGTLGKGVCRNCGKSYTGGTTIGSIYGDLCSECTPNSFIYDEM